MSPTALLREDDDVADQAFTLHAGGQAWALPAQDVRAVFRVGPITPVPLAPPAIEGLVNLRGRVVVAVNLARRMLGECAKTVSGSLSLAVAVEHRASAFALIVDDVGDVVSVDPAERIALPPHIPADIARMTTAWLRSPDGLVPLLNVGRVLDVDVDRRSGLDRRLNPSFAPGAASP